MINIPYENGVGSIMYGMVCSRTDLAYAISVVSRFMANPGKANWEVLKWILRYLRDSTKIDLLFNKQKDTVQPVVGL